MNFTRLTITPEQIEQYGLPGKPRKDGEQRALHIQETVEAEALPATTMRSIVRAAIEALLPPGALEEAAERDANGRARLAAYADELEEGSE
jgi:hypothetical protein